VLSGTCLIFDQWFSPNIVGADGQDLTGWRVLVVPGALDEFLGRLRRGRARFRLLLNHSPCEPIADSADGCLSLHLSPARTRLMVQLRTNNAAGRKAYGMLRHLGRRGWRDLSVSFRKATIREAFPGYHAVIHVGEVPDVSIVLAGACKGCFLRGVA
jgi:hypothetical protein